VSYYLSFIKHAMVLCVHLLNLGAPSHYNLNGFIVRMNCLDDGLPPRNIRKCRDLWFAMSVAGDVGGSAPDLQQALPRGIGTGILQIYWICWMESESAQLPNDYYKQVSATLDDIFAAKV
jgi:hypothetical protein